MNRISREGRGARVGRPLCHTRPDDCPLSLDADPGRFENGYVRAVPVSGGEDACPSPRPSRAALR